VAEQLKDAFQRYRKYKSICRWLVPVFFVDLGLVMISVIIAVVGSHGHAAASPPGGGSGDMGAMFALLLVPVGLLFPLVVIVAAISKCPFCGGRVRNYPSRDVHCIHCGRNIPEEFLAGE
jgi:formate-dependent nitrite reductase membrane component NrfD